MSHMLKGADKVIEALQRRITRATKRFEGTMIVGYSAPYAYVVHEDLERWHPNGQAKFLEEPLRRYTNNGIVQQMIRERVMSGMPMIDALAEVGEFIKQASQALVPVQTGTLRDSAYVKTEEK